MDQKNENNMILIVEDDAGLRTLMARVLQRQGFQTHLASSGQYAIKWLQENHADLILLDFFLPDMTGRELVDQLRATSQDEEIDYILVTGRGDERLAVDMLKHGAHNYLVKDQLLLDLLPSIVNQEMKQINQRQRLEKTELALKKLELHYQTLFENSPLAITLLTSDNQVVAVNDASIRLFGSKIKIGKKFKLLDYLRYPVEFFVMMDLLEKEGYVKNFDLELKEDQGICQFISVTLKKIEMDENNPSTILAMLQDITERKLAENKVLQHQEELAHVSRLSILGEMASGIAHELNQPLCSISNFSAASIRMLEESTGTKQDIIEVLGHLTRQADRAGNIIRRIRSFVRKQSSKLLELDVNDILRESLNLIESEITYKKIRVIEEIPDESCMAIVDAIQIEQVVINLMKNAIDAMTDTPQDQRIITVKCQRRDKIVVSICDSGSGIKENDTEKLFESFYTTKKEGLGIGLSLCRSIVEAHGGHLRAENNKEQGATFIFTLPIKRS
ncbi:MAG: response regulator [Phycisphaerae bacterium]|nr:response regulator [Phycisphaerae bacterium]